MKLAQKIAVWVAAGKSKWFNHSSERLISISLAKKIQQNAYDRAIAYHEEAYSPTYLQIVPDLDDKNEQVFHAAVHYLGKIAENNVEYREPIMILMNNRVASSRLSDTRKQALETKIKYLQGL